MSGLVDVLAVIKDAVKVFETPSFRLLVDHSEFAVEAGTLHQHLMAAYVAVADVLEALRTCDAALMTFANQPLDAPPPWDHLSKALLSSQAALANVGGAK